MLFGFLSGSRLGSKLDKRLRGHCSPLSLLVPSNAEKEDFLAAAGCRVAQRSGKNPAYVRQQR
jgi:hypothetical protein